MNESVKNHETIDETIVIEELIELGEEQGYVHLDDILKAFPQVEENLDLLEDIFAELLSAGIPYVDDGLDELKDRNGSSARKVDEPQPNAKSKDELGNVIEALESDDLMGIYLNQANQVPLLKREEEVELSKRIESGRNASEQLAKGGFSDKDHTQLRHLVEDGLAAREHLILANLRLVFSVAKKYMGRGVPLLDLVQEGHIGLMRATKKFDYRRGYKFSTYATWWIRQAITRALADQGRTIRLPVHMGEKISKMYKARHQLTQQIGRDPTIEELAQELGETPTAVRKMTGYSHRALSLELPVGDEDDTVLGDFVEDRETPEPEESVAKQLMEEYVQDVLEELPAREVRVLQLRFGLWGDRVHTLNESGKKMGITRERVRQIQANALRRLRRLSSREKFLGYILS